MDSTNLPDENAALRPKSFNDFAGQPEITGHLEMMVAAARRRKTPLGHILFVGPPDFGKSTLAQIVADAIEGKVRMVNANSIGKSLGDFAGILTNMDEGDILILEDVQVLDKRVGEFLSQPLKDFKLDIVIDSGPNARPIRLNLPRFTLIVPQRKRSDSRLLFYPALKR